MGRHEGRPSLYVSRGPVINPIVADQTVSASPDRRTAKSLTALFRSGLPKRHWYTRQESHTTPNAYRSLPCARAIALFPYHERLPLYLHSQIPAQPRANSNAL